MMPSRCTRCTCCALHRAAHSAASTPIPTQACAHAQQHPSVLLLALHYMPCFTLASAAVAHQSIVRCLLLLHRAALAQHGTGTMDSNKKHMPTSHRIPSHPIPSHRIPRIPSHRLLVLASPHRIRVHIPSPHAHAHAHAHAHISPSVVCSVSQSLAHTTQLRTSDTTHGEPGGR